MGVGFLQLFDPSTPKASNRDPNSCGYFKCSTVCRANRFHRIFRQHNILFLKAEKVQLFEYLKGKSLLFFRPVIVTSSILLSVLCHFGTQAPTYGFRISFVFKLEPDPKFDPKNAFLNFLKLVILPVLLSDFKCSTVCRANRIYRIFRQHNTVFLKAQKVQLFEHLKGKSLLFFML